MGKDSHNDDRGITVELQRLVCAACEGTATDSQMERLETLLASDPTAMKYYLDYVEVHGWLGRKAAGSNSFPPVEHSTQQATAPTLPIGGFLHGALGKSLIAASLVIGTVLVFMSLSTPKPIAEDSKPEPQEKECVARIIAARDCEWKGFKSEEALGRELLEGERLTLLSGSARIEFALGTKALLHAPAEIVVDSARRGILEYGDVAFDVPKSSRGFSVGTRHANVLVLGTVFNVQMDKEGAGSVGVTRGVVDVVPVEGEGHSKQQQRLAAGYTARISLGADGSSPDITVAEQSDEVSSYQEKLPGERGEHSFQDGLAGYQGTMATFIRSSARASSPDVSYDQEDTSGINFDSSPWLLTQEWAVDSGVPEHSRSLLAFSDLFGDGDHQVPPSAKILSAQLQLHTSNEMYAESEFPVGLFEILVPWQEDNVTWASFGYGGLPNEHFAENPAAQFTPEMASQAYTVDVTESVRRWAAGQDNYGWIILDLGGNRSHFHSDDVFDHRLAPKLTIKYEITENNTTQQAPVLTDEY
ncbi:DNRLRE domain-containing protein [Aeoliella sp.]|uniref:DNRLRE domain-containing protein n=1 Tax=Aeoliella sp. TaxID=2795800 RepID=UPI003CCC3548